MEMEKMAKKKYLAEGDMLAGIVGGGLLGLLLAGIKGAIIGGLVGGGIFFYRILKLEGLI
ncbi:MAG: hypothetical protein ACE5J3_05425 [Methanosarcinales archaeon]